MTIKIKHKRGTASSITTANPTLAAGELAFETDTRRFKVGDGTTAWSSLSYVTPYVTATDRILGRSSAGAGSAEEITCGSFGRSLIGSADAAAARSTLSVQPTASPEFTGKIQVDASNVLLDSQGNLRVFTTDTQAIDKGGSIGLGGKNGAGVFDPWAFGVIKGAKENGTSGNFSGYLAFGTASAGGTITERLRINSSGQLLVTAGSGSSGSYKPGVAVSGDDDTGLQQVGGANTISLVTAGSERVLVDASGNVGIGLSPLQPLHVGRSGTGIVGRFTDNATQTLDIGITASAGVYLDNPNSGYIDFRIGGTSQVRVDAGGNLLVNTTSGDPAGTNATSGCCIAPSSYISVTRSAAPCLYVNRKTDDGTIVSIHQEGTAEGSISVSGTTVSYNAFCGSHWAQLIDNSRPSILRGTVLETIDEMCEWPEGKSDRLARVKVSDTPRSRRVYGVFMAWDEDYAASGDLYATALGAYMVRVSGVVQSGDLLESAGDGTARTQSDDIVRSSTIGKVSSTHRVAEYDDGSYLVPCVLMCG